LSGNPLDRLPYATKAPFNSYQRQDEPPCLDNTRVDILQQIHAWADGQDERCIFWLSGLAGTGKSTISRTVARRCSEQQSLGASFFFSTGGADVSHARKFFTSIARQLAESIAPLNQHICNAIADNSEVVNQSLRDQWHQLVLWPLSKLDGINCRSSYVLIVDALDECDGNNNIRILLELLAEARSLQNVQLRIFLTSRPEIPVRHGFSQIPDTEHQDFVLHSISPEIVNHDISLFLEYKLGLIGREIWLHEGWPGKEIVMQMVHNASGLFIWAATACRYIHEGKIYAAKRLDTILYCSASTTIGPEKHLDEIYITVLQQSVSPEYTDEEKGESYQMLRQVLGSAVILFSPLALIDLHSVLDIPKDQTCPIRLHHPSFRDFLLNKDRCMDLNFWVDEKKAHQTLADSCIQLMSTSLKQNICGVDSLGWLATDADSSRVEQCLPPEIQYACLYWIEHVQKSGAQLHDNDQVHQFLQEHLLHWLEALRWTKKVSEGIYAIASLESIATVSQLLAWQSMFR
jgi:hypothetical protein